MLLLDSKWCMSAVFSMEEAVGGRDFSLIQTTVTDG